MTDENEGLPRGWIWATLGDLVDQLQYGFTASASSDTAGPRFLRITDLGVDGIDWTSVPGCVVTPADARKYGLRDGDVVFARTGSIEKAAVVRNPPAAVFASYLIRGRPLTSGLSEWIGRFVRSGHYLEQIGAAGAGIGRENVNATKLSAVRVPLAPEREQHRVVAKLDEILASVRRVGANLDSVQRSLDLQRDAVLSFAFRGGLTDGWRTAGPETALGGETVLREIAGAREAEWRRVQVRGAYANASTQQDGPYPLPGSWRWATLEQLTSAVSSICYGVVQPGDEHPGGVRLVRVCDVDGGQVLAGDLRTIAPHVDAEYARSRLRGGEVLVTVVGTIGRVAVAPASLAGANIARAVARLCPIAPITPEWIAYALMTPEAQAVLTRESREVARKTLNVGSLARVMIPVAPVEEMREIVRRVQLHLESCERQLAAVAGARARLHDLEKAALAKAFRGELLPQDASDEPADALLARLSAASPADVGRRRPRRAATA